MPEEKFTITLAEKFKVQSQMITNMIRMKSKWTLSINSVIRCRHWIETFGEALYKLKTLIMIILQSQLL